MARGTVYRRTNGVWSVKVELPRDPATGKRRQKVTGGFKTRREAESALTADAFPSGFGSMVEVVTEASVEAASRGVLDDEVTV